MLAKLVIELSRLQHDHHRKVDRNIRQSQRMDQWDLDGNSICNLSVVSVVVCIPTMLDVATAISLATSKAMSTPMSKRDLVSVLKKPVSLLSETVRATRTSRGQHTHHIAFLVKLRIDAVHERDVRDLVVANRGQSRHSSGAPEASAGVPVEFEVWGEHEPLRVDLQSADIDPLDGRDEPKSKDGIQGDDFEVTDVHRVLHPRHRNVRLDERVVDVRMAVVAQGLHVEVQGVKRFVSDAAIFLAQLREEAAADTAGQSEGLHACGSLPQFFAEGLHVHLWELAQTTQTVEAEGEVLQLCGRAHESPFHEIPVVDIERPPGAVPVLEVGEGTCEGAPMSPVADQIVGAAHNKGFDIGENGELGTVDPEERIFVMEVTNYLTIDAGAALQRQHGELGIEHLDMNQDVLQGQQPLAGHRIEVMIIGTEVNFVLIFAHSICREHSVGPDGELDLDVADVHA